MQLKNMTYSDNWKRVEEKIVYKDVRRLANDIKQLEDVQ